MSQMIKTLALAATLGGATLAATGAAAVTYDITQQGDGSTTTILAPTGGPFEMEIIGNDNAIGCVLEDGSDDCTPVTWPTDNLINGFSVTAGARERLTVTGSFDYFTNDYDPEGGMWDWLYLEQNGLSQILSDANASSTGLFSFVIAPGQSFSFFIESEDGMNGAAFATIAGTIDVALVPLPAAGLMLLGGLGGLALLRRRKAA